MTSPLTGNEYIHRELGKMTALLESMQKSQEEFRAETKEHRTEVTKTLTDMDDRMAAVESLSRKNSSAITEDVMPTVKEVKAWKQRGVGFLAFAGMAGTGLGVALMKYADAIRATAQDFFK